MRLLHLDAKIRRRPRVALLLVLPALLLALAASGELHESAPRPNVLLVVLDDVGTDKIGAYHEVPQCPRTPRIDALAAEGLLFRNAYANPLCSATRAALLTGRYGRRTGVGGNIPDKGRWGLPLEEVTLAELLGAHGYATAAVGKWHLMGPGAPEVALHPNRQGFAHYQGALHNLYFGAGPERPGYFHYDKTIDGTTTRVDEYATSATTDDALCELERLPEPWFLYVAYNAAHAPLHAPPGSSLAPDAPKADEYDAMVEHVDGEIERLLEGLAPAQRAHTVIVLLGDNGTNPDAIRPPRDPEEGKATLYEGGVNVPLIVAGTCVARRGSETAALAHVVDLFPTLAALAGVARDEESAPLDGLDLAAVLANPDDPGPRRFVYCERFDRFEDDAAGPYRLDWRTVRDERYKLLDLDGKRELHDLSGRDDDGPALALDRLTEQQRAHLALLEAELARVAREAKYAH